MPHFDDTFDNYTALISLGVTKELVDAVREKGLNLAAIFQAIKTTSPPFRLQVQYEWQLLILGKSDFDCSLLPAEVWKQTDNLGNTPVQYFAWSGNSIALNWVLTNKPELLDNKNNTERTIAHYAAQSGHPEALSWVLANKPELIDGKSKTGTAIAHFAAQSGNPEMLQWILINTPELLNSKNIQGTTIAHSAALSGNPDALQWILINKPELLDEKDDNDSTIAHFASFSGKLEALSWVLANKPGLLIGKNKVGRTIAHHAALSGNLDILNWLLVNKPELLDSRDNNGCNIAHFAAASAHTEILSWILAKKPELLDSKSNSDITIAHAAAQSLKPKALQWISDNKPELLNSKTKNDNGIAHFGVGSGNTDVLSWILAHKPELLNNIDKCGMTIAHHASLLEKPEVLCWIFANKPELLDIRDNKGSTIAFYAVSAHLETLQWIIANKPGLLDVKTTNVHSTILHFAARSGKVATLTYLLQNHPALIKKLWVPTKHGDTPHEAALPDITIKPNQIRDNELFAATNRFIENRPNKNDAALLFAFQVEWQEAILKGDGCDITRLIATTVNFPVEIRAKIEQLIPLLRLKAFSFKDELVTRSQLHDLLEFTKAALPPLRSVFFVSTERAVIDALTHLLAKLKSEELNRQQVLCLQLIVDDYERGILGTSSPGTQLMAKKLLTSTTLSQLRPKAEITTGLDIRVENFAHHLTTYRERVARLPLSEDTAKTMREVMFPGIEALISDEEKIVLHVTTHFGVNYHLHEKLPLHTDHIPTRDAEAYRQMLHRLLINLLGAAEIAHSKGRLSEFCDKLSSGYCFEGRVRDAFDWVASLSEIVSFDTLMDRYINNEYLPYAEVISGVTLESATFIKPACDFIMARHHGMPCLPHPIYAPTGEITQAGVKKYFDEVLSYTAGDETLFGRFRHLFSRA